MKALVVAESFLPSVNGVTTTVLRTLDYLAENGHEALIVCPGPAPREYRGFKVLEVTSFPWMGMRVGFPTRILSMAMKSFNPDVVHVAAPFSLGLHALVLAERRNIPSCAVFQTDLPGFARRNGLTFLATPSEKWLNFTHQRADVNLAPSTTAADELREMGVEDVIVWPHGVDAVLFDPAKRNNAKGQEFRTAFARTGRPVIGYVGRLAPEKEVGRLAGVADLGDIVIVGDGIARNKIREAIPDAYFAGRQSGEDLASAYAALDIFVHTGRFETFGLTIQEAMASGVPVVAPNQGGPVDQVNHGVDGFLFDPDKPEEMRHYVSMLVNDDDLRERMGREARRSALSRSWDAINETLIGYWELAIAINAVDVAQPA